MIFIEDIGDGSINRINLTNIKIPENNIIVDLITHVLILSSKFVFDIGEYERQLKIIK